MVKEAFKPSTQEADAGESLEFEASLVWNSKFQGTSITQ